MNRMSTSLNDRLEAYFKERPNEWIDGRELARVAGAYAWRTRVSDLRKRGIAVQNRVVRLRFPDGKPYKVSEYRYLPVTVRVDASRQAAFL